jgi:hypothetical protein
VDVLELLPAGAEFGVRRLADAGCFVHVLLRNCLPAET